MNTETADFQLFYSRLLFREYLVRKAGPLARSEWSHLLLWARKAKHRYWELEREASAQGELFA